jgi:hypothetical protein
MRTHTDLIAAGTVLELRKDNLVTYVQVVFDDPAFTLLVRVIPGVFDRSLSDTEMADRVASSPDAALAWTFLRAEAMRTKALVIAPRGMHPLPVGMAPEKLYRKPYPPEPGSTTQRWQLCRPGGEKVIVSEPLSEKDARLPRGVARSYSEVLAIAEVPAD